MEKNIIRSQTDEKCNTQAAEISIQALVMNSQAPVIIDTQAPVTGYKTLNKFKKVKKKKRKNEEATVNQQFLYLFLSFKF